MTKLAAEGHNTDSANIIKRWLNILNEVDTLQEDLKELKEEAKGKGFGKVEMKAMALVIKEHRKPLEVNVKAYANEYFANSNGQYVIFAE